MTSMMLKEMTRTQVDEDLSNMKERDLGEGDPIEE
jgi:hypothetical protein